MMGFRRGRVIAADRGSPSSALLPWVTRTGAQMIVCSSECCGMQRTVRRRRPMHGWSRRLWTGTRFSTGGCAHVRRRIPSQIAARAALPEAHDVAARRHSSASRRHSSTSRRHARTPDSRALCWSAVSGCGRAPLLRGAAAEGRLRGTQQHAAALCAVAPGCARLACASIRPSPGSIRKNGRRQRRRPVEPDGTARHSRMSDPLARPHRTRMRISGVVPRQRVRVQSSSHGKNRKQGTSATGCAAPLTKGRS